MEKLVEKLVEACGSSWKLVEACGYDEDEQCRSEPGLDGDLQLMLDHLLDLLRQLADDLVLLLTLFSLLL